MFIIVLIFSTLRLSNDPLEIYACVTKIYGHGRCLVHTVCGKELLCIIRNKFKGRSKRGNTIATGTILLVGLREWEPADNYKNCDVLEIYDNEDHNQLKSIPSTKVQQLEKYTILYQNDRIKSDDVLFTDEEDVENEHQVKKQFIPLSSLSEKDEEGIENEDEIQIDDI